MAPRAGWYNRSVKLRLKSFADVDPLKVPLPNGTEITTRVERMAGDHRVSQGALGRVVGAAEGAFDVHIVGVGVVRYLRDELMPRKLGQLRFARRREVSWDALRPCLVLDAVVGSRAWGLADENSDVDRRGFFALPFAWTTGLVEPPLDLISDDSSTTYWEIGKGIRQAIRADPNTLEVLFVDTVEAVDPIGEWLLEARDAFVSAEIYGSFGRYALSQLKRLEQSRRLAEHRHLLLVWLRDQPSLTLDELATRLASESDVAAPSQRDAVLRAKDYVKQLYRSMYDQGLLPTREFAALAEYARKAGEGAEFESPRELRPKNAYNLIRLIHTGIVWLRTGKAEMRVRGPLRDTLLDIKKGRMSLSDVLSLAESMTPDLEAARQESTLPAQADVERIDDLLRRIREEIARRHLAGEPGPLGADAPLAPRARWDG